MTQKGYEEYLDTIFDAKNGTIKSYITAIRIIDEIFSKEDVFGLNGVSIANIEDTTLLLRIKEFVYAQQKLFKKGQDSIFRNISTSQTSYPQKGFCSAAVNQLLNYHYQYLEEKKANTVVASISNGHKVAKELVDFFDIDKEGSEKEVMTRTRLGQSYFRRMVLANYGGKCCVTGLDVPQTLRASHIVAWAEDKKNRMNPENGLCLSATYDAAFDKHLISFDDDYRMIVSKDIKEYYTNEATKEYFNNFEGKQINLPLRFMPSKKLLEKHRNLMVC